MPGSLRAGEAELAAAVTWTSRWANTDSRVYVGDGEAVWMTAWLSLGMTDRVELTVEVPAAWHGGGGMDGLISFFHRVVGTNDNERDDYPENGFRFELHDSDGSDWIADSREKGAFFEDPTLRLSVLVCEGVGRAPRLSLDLSFSPGGGRSEEFMTDPGPELAAGFTAAKGWGPWRCYLGLAEAFEGAKEFGGVELARTRTEGFLAGEYEWREGRSLVAQWLFSTGFAEDFYMYDESAHEIHLGTKWRARGAVWELAAIENFMNYDNSPDLGFHFGVRLRF
jgi:hypothetical protein